MKNKREINPKSGKRLKELIAEQKTTQEKLSEKLGCTPQHLSLIVVGKKRLTEENARTVAKIYPHIRYEWLMGWDDYKTKLDYEYAQIMDEVEEIEKESSEVIDREEDALAMIREIGYRIASNNTEKRKDVKEMREIFESYDFIDRHMEELLVFFTTQEIEEAISKRMSKFMTSLSKDMGKDCEIMCDFSFSHDLTSKADKQKVVDEKEKYLNECRERETWDASFWKNINKPHDLAWNITDKSGNILAHCTSAEREIFLKEFHDITNLLVIGFIDRLNKQERKRKRKTKKED